MNDSQNPLTVLILDTKTRKTHTSTVGYTVDWWSTGNGSCDCNRVPSEEIEQELNNQFGEDICYGNHRFLIIDILSKDYIYQATKLSTLLEMNQEYPFTLIQQYIIKGNK